MSNIHIHSPSYKLLNIPKMKVIINLRNYDTGSFFVFPGDVAQELFKTGR